MKALSKFLSLATVVAALCVAGLSLYLYFCKKKEDEELENYLDNSIQ